MAKKKVVKRKKKVVKKKVVKKKAAVPVKVEPGDVMTVDLSKFGYELPDTLKAQQRMLATKMDAGDDAEKHVALILTKMKQDETHLRHNFSNFGEFCNEKLNLATGTTSNGLKLVASFVEMGLAPKVFKKITPSHVHLIYRGWKDGALSPKLLSERVAQAVPGKDYLNRQRMQEAIYKDLGIEAGKSGQQTKNFVVHPETGAAQEIIQSCLGILKEHPIYGEYTASQVFEKALQEFTANHSKDAKPSFLSADAALNMLASMLPKDIVPILVAANKEAVENLPAELAKMAQKRLVTSVFACFKDYKKVEVLTTTKARAAKVMKVDEGKIRETDIEVDKALIPKEAGRFFDVITVVSTKPKPPKPADLLKLDDDELKKLANLMGFKVTARMSRKKALLMLLTDEETYGMTKEDAEALIAPKKEKKAVKKKAVKKKVAKKKKAAKKPKEEEESEEEESEEEDLSDLMPDDKPEEESEEEEEEEELTEEQAREKSKANLSALKGGEFISQADLGKKIKEINEENPGIVAKDRLMKVLTWSRELCEKNGLECE